MKCKLFAVNLHTFLTVCTLYLMGNQLSCILTAEFSFILIPAVHTLCILIFCALQTFCRPRAYIAQSKCVSFKCSTAICGGPSPLFSRAEEQRLRCYGRHRRIIRPWAKRRQRGGLPPFTAKRRRRRPPPPSSLEGEAQRSVRRPSGTAAAGCGDCKPGQGEEERYARAGMREGGARDWAGRGQGLGARASRRGPRAP
jgi:hypothetical protein